MKLLYIVSTLLLSLNCFAQLDSIFAGGIYRQYTVHTPPSYTPGTPLPLVLGFHGLAGDMDQFRDQSQLNVKADASDFIVVYPRGTKGPVSLRSWNAGYCCSYASFFNIDDVGFVNALLDTLIMDYSIDTMRIFSTGHSNGSMMSYRLACELSDRIAAIGVSAGAYVFDNPCNPTRPVPTIHVHSYLDSINPVQGGVSTLGPYFPPSDSALNVFANSTGCVNVFDTVYTGVDYDHIRWHDCLCLASYELYITKDGGHSWAGGMQTPGGNPVSTVLSTTDLIWDFFQLHSLDCPVVGLNEKLPDNEVFIAPNPTSGITELKGVFESYQLVDATGKYIYTDNHSTIDIGHHPKGVYFLKVNTGQGLKVLKLIRK